MDLITFLADNYFSPRSDNDLSSLSKDFKVWMANQVYVATAITVFCAYVINKVKGRQWKLGCYLGLAFGVLLLLLQVTVLYVTFSNNILPPVIVLCGIVLWVMGKGNRQGGDSSAYPTIRPRVDVPVHRAVSNATFPADSQPCNVFITPAVTTVGEASTSLELFAPKFRDLLWDDCSGIFLCGIEAGEFVMGSPPNELGHRENENLAKVVISEGFWMARTPCTQFQWEAVMGTNPSRFPDPEHPVEQITWEEASEFCVVLTRIQHETGQLPLKAKWSLPSEAQWEYACRAGHRSSLNNGTAIKHERKDCRNLDEVAWYRNNSGGTTHPVGEKVPNAWGLYDMHGNVWEWCRDWYLDLNHGGQDPCNLAIGQYRAIRGGGWGDLPWACRSAVRHQNPLPKDSDFGFRPIICW